MSITLTEQELKKLNNEIAIPHFREFCRDNNLSFHFGDELSSEKFNSAIAYKETKPFFEAINIYNSIHHEYRTFDGIYVKYLMTASGIDFVDAITQEEFLKRFKELEKHNKKLRTETSVFAVVAIFLGGFAVTYISSTFLYIYAPYSNALVLFAYLLILLALPNLIYSLKEKYRKKGIAGRLNSLREKI